MVDTLGLLVVVLVTAASAGDRDGGARVLDRAKMAMPSLALIFADGGYAGRLVAFARRLLRIVVQVVRKPEGQRGFAVPAPAPGGGAHLVLADRAPPSGTGLRTPSRALRSLGQVGHDRTHDPPAGPRTRPQTLAMTTFPTRSESRGGGGAVPRGQRQGISGVVL